VNAKANTTVMRDQLGHVPDTKKRCKILPFGKDQVVRVSVMAFLAIMVAGGMLTEAIWSQDGEGEAIHKAIEATDRIGLLNSQVQRISKNLLLLTISEDGNSTKEILRQEATIRSDIKAVRENLRFVSTYVSDLPDASQIALRSEFGRVTGDTIRILNASEDALNRKPNSSASSDLAKLSDDLITNSAQLQKKLDQEHRAFHSSNHATQRQFILLSLLSIASIIAVSLVPALRSLARQQGGMVVLNQDLTRLATVIEKSSNAVVISDVDRKVVWANRAFCDLCGYQLEEVIGKVPGSLVQSEKTNPETMARISSALEKRESVHVEILNVSKHGNEYWIDLTIDPLFDDLGQLTGFISIESDITDFVKAKEELTRNEFLLEQMARTAKVGGWSYRIGADRSEWSKGVCRIHGVPEGTNPTTEEGWSFYPPASRELIEAAWKQAIENRQPYDIEVPLINGHGEKVYTRSIGNPIIENGEVVGMIGSCQDISEIVRAREEFRKNEMILEHMADLAKVGAWELDLRTSTVEWSREVKRIHEVPLDYCPTLDQAIEFYVGDAKNSIRELVSAAISEGKIWDVELPIQTAKGKLRWVRSIGEAVFEGGVAVKVRGSFQDVTERRLLTDELKDLAMTDSLTGLPNRASIQKSIDEAILECHQEEKNSCAVIFLDADRFKVVNDSLGHETGDVLLKAIAERLHGSVRVSDSLPRSGELDIAARIGGDEFVILLRGLSKSEDVVVAADRILKSISEPYTILGHSITINASMGIVTNLTEYETHSDVLRDADTAMYQAKSKGKGQFVFFNLEMHEHIQETMRIEIELRQAIHAGELMLHYQPILSLNDRKPVSCEALVRWNHPTRGFLGPIRFMPIAEESDLVIEVGKWVLNEACRQFVEWMSGPEFENLPDSVSVNIARRQLYEPGFVEGVLETMERHGMPAEALHLEITETGVMQDVELARTALNRLREQGIKISLDDFGTGHSALSCLHDLPIDILKLDKSFLDQMLAKDTGLAIVQAVVTLAQVLGIAIVAEGIEQEEQADQLEQLWCTYGQGYLFSKPLDARAFELKCLEGFEQSPAEIRVA
jgi:diguanylate cyclase (GGDEF)-like protein/PAS domain S-box-containing protein